MRLPDPVRLVIELVAEDGLSIGKADVELRDGTRSNTLRNDSGTNLFRSGWIWPGEYQLFVRGEDIVPVQQELRVAGGVEGFQRVVCPRGMREQ